MNVYVGNLSCAVNETDLDMLFGGVGDVVFARLLAPAETDVRARGYAFVAFRETAEARAAIEGLDGAYLKGTHLIVRAVDSRAPREITPLPTARRARPQLRVIRGRRAAAG